MNRAASPAIALSGLCVGISSAALFFSLGQSGSSGAQLNAYVWVVTMTPVTTVVAASCTCVTFICHTPFHNGDRRRIREVMFFILCTSISLLDLFMFIQPGPMDGFQAPVPVRVAAVGLLPHAAAVTFFLAVVLVYVYVGTIAGNQKNPGLVLFLNKITLSATVVAAALSMIACNTQVN